MTKNEVSRANDLIESLESLEKAFNDQEQGTIPPDHLVTLCPCEWSDDGQDIGSEHALVTMNEYRSFLRQIKIKRTEELKKMGVEL